MSHWMDSHPVCPSHTKKVPAPKGARTLGVRGQDSMTLRLPPVFALVAGTFHWNVPLDGFESCLASHTKKVPAPDGARHFMVRATGLEPARLSQRNLNPPSLPIPPRPQIEFPEYFITTQDGCQLSRMLLSRMGKLYQKFRRFPLTFRQSTSRIDSVWCTLKIVLL